jgi:hypothetical protein
LDSLATKAASAHLIEPFRVTVAVLSRCRHHIVRALRFFLVPHLELIGMNDFVWHFAFPQLYHRL